MPEPDPTAAIRTPSGTKPPPGGLPDGSPPFPVPDHTLIRRIGRGAYGEVWLARNALGTWRAVKFVRRSSFDDDRPFEREFAGIQRFEPISRSHESQLNILHVGRAEYGFYYVMELADDMGRGQEIDEATYTPRNLRSELHVRGRLPAAECLRLGLALTTALEHLHKHGLVHRDIKPSNIVFVNGIPKLADIGLVARAEATISFVGTEGFLPPEGPGTRQADIYSLGKVLYELSTGHDRKQFPELPTNIVELPDRAELSELNEVLLKACHRDPRERYQTAAEMHADLALLESGRSVVRLRGLERRLRFVQRAGAVVTVIAALAAGLYLWQARQTQKVRQLVVEKTQLSEQNRQIANEKTKLADENRERIVRLDIANGVRLLDANDPSAALLWFADALPLVTNNPAAEDIHRIRIQQTLNQTPRLLNVMNHEGTVTASAFSLDGLRLATATWINISYTKLAVSDAKTGQLLWELKEENKPVQELRFARDGQRLFVSSSANLGNGSFGNDWMDPVVGKLAEVLDTQTGKPVFPQLSSNLFFSAFSPDDRWLAVALTNHVIQLLDTRNGQLVVELRGHTNDILRLAFSDDGSLLASGSRDGSARIWRLPSGEPMGAPLMLDQTVRRVVLSPEGRCLATATWEPDEYPKESRVQVWDVQAGKRVGESITEIGPTYSLLFDPKGDVLLTSAEKTHGETPFVRVWNVGSSLTLQRAFAFPLVRCWDFSPDGRMLALGADAGIASIWSTETWDLLFPSFRHNDSVESIHFSPDGRQLVTTSQDGAAKIWSLRQNVETARLVLSANHLAGPPEGARPRGRTPGPIPMTLTDLCLHLVDPEQLVEIQTLKAQPTNAPLFWAAGSTGRYWACLPLRKTDLGYKSSPEITLWKREDGGFRSQLLRHPKNLAAMQFNADDSRLVTIGGDGFIRFWRTSDGTIERSVPIPESMTMFRNEFLPEPFDRDCRKLLHSDDGEHGRVLDLVTGQYPGKELTPGIHPGLMRAMRLSPDGRYLGCEAREQEGCIIDLETGELAVPPLIHGGNVRDLDWSPDSRRLITAGEWSSEVKLWDVATGEMLFSPMATTPSTATASARSARWSADGRFIATRSDDNKARVWDASTTEPVTPFLSHSGYIRWLCITPGNRLITASDPNLLRAWDLKPTPLPVDVIADYAKLLSGRRLNAGGVLLPIPAKELAELAQSLRTRAPQLFE